MGDRTLLVSIPDTDSAEDLIRGIASQLQAGVDLIFLRRPPGIPSSAMPVVVAHCTAILMAAGINALGDRQVAEQLAEES